MKVRVCLLLLAGLACAAPGAAQTYGSAKGPSELHWGLMASFAPWTAGDRYKGFYDARQLDFTGDEVRFGVTRGGRERGEFAFLFVRKRIDEGSSLVNLHHEQFAIGPRVYVTGLMAEQFLPFTTIAHTVQIGMVIAAGAGKASGTATRVSDGVSTPSDQVLRVFALPREFQPLARAELAVALAARPGMKLRLSGGFDWPGSTRLSVTAMYFFGD
jgi:hypothetical protein